MPIPPNIDLFNRFSLALFGKLYLTFPVAIDLDVDELLMSVLPEDVGAKEAFDALSVGGEAIEFLASEGFLTHDGATMGGSEFASVRLTMKGLTVLGSVPNSLEKKESLISKILTVAGKGLKDAAAEHVSDLSNQAFTLALSSAPALVNALRQ